MTIRLNKPVCATRYGNTGYGSCWFDPKKVKGAFQVSEDFVIPPDTENLQQLLKTQVLAIPELRLFAYHDFVGITDQTEDTQIETTDYGNKYKTRDGDYDLSFRFTKGGVQLYQEMQKNEGEKHFLFYDQDGYLFGYNTTEGLKGVPMLFLTKPWTFATGSTSAQYLLRFIFDPIYINRGNLGFVKAEGFNFFDIKGLQDVTLTLANLAGNVATVIAETLISGVNMQSVFGASLVQTSAWVATDQDGNTVPITGITQNAAAQGSRGGYDFTFNTVAFNNADTVLLRMAYPATLAAPPISVNGYDTSTALEIEAPGS